MRPIEVPSDFCVIAHRGASGYAPENTMPAFSIAKDMGATHVELDTQLSTDGVVVLCHDEKLARYGHGRRKVEKLASNVLLQLDMGAWFSEEFKGTRMLTLEELLSTCGRDFTYHIELKGAGEGLSCAVHEVVEKAGMMDSVIFRSFSLQHLTRMRELSVGCRLGWLFKKGVSRKEITRQAERLSLFQLCPHVKAVDKKMVDHGLTVVSKIWAWGLGTDPERIEAGVRKLVEAGCDGTTINWPDLLVKNA